MRQTFSYDDIQQKIDKLGQDPDSVATMLKEAKATGWPAMSEACPIANYLRKSCDCRSVTVGVDQIMVGFWYFNTDPAVREFIIKFDKGEYPELQKFRWLRSLSSKLKLIMRKVCRRK